MKFIVAKKAQVFVAHIQDHLDRHDIIGDRVRVYRAGRELPPGKVGCKICNRTVDRIYDYWRRTGDVGWA